MSTPGDRLIADVAAESFGPDAAAVLAQHLNFDPVTQQLALATMALIRDRNARQELSVIDRHEKSA
jgi:hypothetical protein